MFFSRLPVSALTRMTLLKMCWQRGATAVVVSREDCAALKGALKVDDTLAALQMLAKAWRENVNPFDLRHYRLFRQNDG